VAPLVFTTALTSAGDVLISLTGELDLSGAGPLDEELDRLAAEDGVRRVVLDLRGLEFMDSSGLRLVALAERRLGAADRPLVPRVVSTSRSFRPNPSMRRRRFSRTSIAHQCERSSWSAAPNLAGARTVAVSLGRVATCE
jgi:anti-anti-sigma factor